ncbi:prolyl oligopeptidase family serine peptidase [Steroidobacter sp.]|uniref:S9 family peptidase n=1 Tax=Steroidobacter sp. TaxID=1978227 RepID=UPI001A5067DD|nr:prolyl oligopeptidase family serine peptidase [Steroidobacter sp.]MBL8266268.1 S9 family peptidase [Steroidobacter sp.]
MSMTHKTLLVSLCLWVATASAAGSTTDPTIDELLSAPFPYGLTAARQGETVAWIANHRGARNIYLGQAGADGKVAVRSLTKLEGDNGIELADLQWSYDSSTLVFSRGGSLEGGGPVNPLSQAAGPVAMEVAAVRLDSGEVRSFGLGSGAVTSPAGNEVVFVRDGQIWLGDLAQSSPATPLLVDKGAASDLAWSPDGKRLAFVSNRKDYSVVGVFDLATRKLQWLSPGADRDYSPIWSPDGKRLAWIRMPSSELSFLTDAFIAKRAGQPWSIWTAEVANGNAQRAWVADAGPGSVFQPIETGPSLFWTADDQLLFPWEVSGWLRLHSLDLKRKGARPVALSQDGAETFAATLDRAGREVIYSSNADDDDHRHLWRIPAKGGKAQRLSQGESIEDFPVVTEKGAVFAMHSTARKPLTPALVQSNGSLQAVRSNDQPFPSDRLVMPQRVIFKSPDGVSVHGQLFLPAGQSSAKKPAVLFFHGGPQRQMLLGWHPMGAYTHMYAMNQFLVLQGYVVLSVNFRGGTGYGLNFREPDDFAAGGGSEARDIGGAVDYLKSRGDIDAARIGVYGMSYGGVMTSLALARYPQEFAVGVDMAGVHNWKSFIPQMTSPGFEAAGELAFQSSAMGTIKNWRAPVLLIHGDDDRAVDYSQTTELVRALRSETQVEPELLIIPNEVHDFILHRSWRRVFEATHEFLGKYLHRPQGS